MNTVAHLAWHVMLLQPALQLSTPPICITDRPSPFIFRLFGPSMKIPSVYNANDRLVRPHIVKRVGGRAGWRVFSFPRSHLIAWSGQRVTRRFFTTKEPTRPKSKQIASHDVHLPPRRRRRYCACSRPRARCRRRRRCSLLSPAEQQSVGADVAPSPVARCGCAVVMLRARAFEGDRSNFLNGKALSPGNSVNFLLV